VEVEVEEREARVGRTVLSGLLTEVSKHQRGLG
jgi:hypothetical protein